MRHFLAAACGASLVAMPAQAGIFSNIYQGLQYATTPSGGPLSFGPNGSRVNGSRLGFVRVQPNQFGNGWRLEANRIFGADSLGRPEVFDFGNFELELQGGMTLDAGFTRRGLPSANLTWGTNNLSYSLRGKSGAQDIELSGTLTGLTDVEVNPLGFYETTLDFSNFNAEFDATGLAIDGDVDTDFDIGPITIRGNLYVDIFAGVLSSFGVDTTPLTNLFPDSPIERIIADFQAEADKLNELSNARVLSVVDYSGLSGYTGLEGPGGFARIPEPASLFLLATGGLLALRRR